MFCCRDMWPFIYKCTCMYVFIAPLRDYLRRWCSTWCHLILLIILIAPCCFEIWRPILSWKKLWCDVSSFLRFGPLHPKWANGQNGPAWAAAISSQKNLHLEKRSFADGKSSGASTTYKRDLDTLRTPLFFKTARALHNGPEDFHFIQKSQRIDKTNRWTLTSPLL